jgi:hypothetical protein
MSCERNNFFDTKNNASSTCTVVVAVSINADIAKSRKVRTELFFAVLMFHAK